LFRKLIQGVELSLADEQEAAGARLATGEIHVGIGRYYPTEPGLVIEEVVEEGVAISIPKGWACR
jgi:hypothetical protein